MANLTHHVNLDGSDIWVVDYDPKVQDHIHVCPWPSNICTVCGVDTLSELKRNNPELFTTQR